MLLPLYGADPPPGNFTTTGLLLLLMMTQSRHTAHPFSQSEEDTSSCLPSKACPFLVDQHCSSSLSSVSFRGSQWTHQPHKAHLSQKEGGGGGTAMMQALLRGLELLNTNLQSQHHGHVIYHPFNDILSSYNGMSLFEYVVLNQ